jgi:hypothetical protein
MYMCFVISRPLSPPHGMCCRLKLIAMCAETGRDYFIHLITSQREDMYRKAQRSGLHAVQWVGQFKTMGFINFYLYSGPHPATARQLILGGHKQQALVGFKSRLRSTAKWRRVSCCTQSAPNLITLLNNAVL